MSAPNAVLRCGAKYKKNGLQCDLDEGHYGWHKTNFWPGDLLIWPDSENQP